MTHLSLVNRPEVHYYPVTVLLLSSLHSRRIGTHHFVLTEVYLSCLGWRSVTLNTSLMSFRSAISHLIKHFNMSHHFVSTVDVIICRLMRPHNCRSSLDQELIHELFFF